MKIEEIHCIHDRYKNILHKCEKGNRTNENVYFDQIEENPLKRWHGPRVVKPNIFLYKEYLLIRPDPYPNFALKNDPIHSAQHFVTSPHPAPLDGHQNSDNIYFYKNE